MKTYLVKKFSFVDLRFFKLGDTCQSYELVIPLSKNFPCSEHVGCMDCTRLCSEMKKYFRKIQCNLDSGFELTIFPDTDKPRFCAKLEGDILQSLFQSFGEDTRASLTLQIFDAQAFGPDYGPTGKLLSDIESRKFQIKSENGEYFCEAKMRYPKDWRDVFQSNCSANYLDGCLSIKLIVENFCVTDMLSNWQLFQNDNVITVNKRILSYCEATDLKLRSADGVDISCHKIFLTAQSPVFAEMLMDINNPEGDHSMVELEDMTESAVRAFLNFVYCREIVEAMKDSKIAMQMLICAYKYNFDSMKAAMKEIMLYKPFPWFDVNVALNLYYFGYKLKAQWELKQKALQVLKRKPASEIQNAIDYRRLYYENTAAGDELCNVLSLVEPE